MSEQNNLKKKMSEGIRQGKEAELDPKVRQKIEEIKEEFVDLVEKLAPQHDFNIPFSVFHDETGYDYTIISDVLLNLIYEGKVKGFINDSGTEALSDDILIVKKGERYLDKMEPEYRTG